jgi:predicted nucleic acid-binding protein
VSRTSLERAVTKDERILLDTSTLISYLGVPDAVTPVATHVIDEWVRSGRNPAIISMVTAMEVLVEPLTRGPGEEFLHVMDFLQRFPNLKAQPVDLVVAQEAASLRAQHKFRPPDALVIGTGVIAQVGCLVTNDKDWKKKLAPIAARVKVCYLEDHLPF